MHAMTMRVTCCGVAALTAVLLACDFAFAGTTIRVIDAESGAPIANAQVRLSTADEASTRVWDSETDHEGLARPIGISADVYRLEVEKDGYLNAANTAAGGRAVRITDGVESRLLVPVVRATAVSGAVTDADGRPLSGMWVVALPRTEITDRAPVGTIAAGAFTDDRGRYRLYSLLPGEYRIAAEPRGESVSSRLRGMAYYPGESQFTNAQLLSLAPGAELHSIDIRFAVPPPGSLRGSVSEIPREWRLARAAVSLVPIAGVRVPVADVTTETSGRFQIDGIPAGDYIVLAWGPLSRSGLENPPEGDHVYYAHGGVTVGGGRSSDLNLSLAPGLRVDVSLSGDSRCAGTTNIRMRMVEPWFDFWTFKSQPTEDGLQFSSVPPGMYRFEMPDIEASCTFLGVLAQNGTTPGRVLEIRGSTTVAAVVAPSRGEVSGTVRFKGAPVRAAELLLWSPTAGTSWETAASESGVFRFSRLPAGNYKMCARFVQQAEGSAATNLPLEIQRQFELTDGEQAVVDLIQDKED